MDTPAAFSLKFATESVDGFRIVEPERFKARVPASISIEEAEEVPLRVRFISSEANTMFFTDVAPLVQNVIEDVFILKFRTEDKPEKFSPEDSHSPSSPLAVHIPEHLKSSDLPMNFPENDTYDRKLDKSTEEIAGIET